MEYIIRDAVEKDCIAVYDFTCLLEDANFNLPEFAMIFSRYIHQNNAICLLATFPNDIPIGFITCHIQYLLHHCGPVAEIHELFVGADFRQLGVGNRLVKEVENRMIKAGCLLMEVTSQNKRMAARKFYERFGFSNSHQKFVKQLS